MQTRIPPRRPLRVHLLSILAGLWAVIALAGVLFMVEPLVSPPTSAPPAQARPAGATPAGAATLPERGAQQGTGSPQKPVPVWINAPKANINSSVVPVGIDAQGAMAAPEGANSSPVWFQTFWWRYGAMPGQIGNAVIAGHLDRKDGSPAIFWNLSKLAPGDSVFVRTALGVTLHFVVTAVTTFANPTGGVADPTLQRIFGPAQTANLNLITCAGDWTGSEYTKKLVVFTTLAP